MQAASLVILHILLLSNPSLSDFLPWSSAFEWKYREAAAHQAKG